MIVSPWGKVLTHMDEKEGMTVTEINFDEIARIREQLPILKQKRMIGGEMI
jgi:predicted amidohydrolase